MVIFSYYYYRLVYRSFYFPCLTSKYYYHGYSLTCCSSSTRAIPLFFFPFPSLFALFSPSQSLLFRFPRCYNLTQLYSVQLTRSPSFPSPLSRPFILCSESVLQIPLTWLLSSLSLRRLVHASSTGFQLFLIQTSPLASVTIVVPFLQLHFN